MSKKLLLSALCLMMAFCVNMNAQTTLISEGFEQGLPAAWTQDPSTGVTAWTVSSSGLNGVTAYDGTNYAALYTTTQQVNTKLILPLTDISSLTNPEFSFYLVQQARGVNTGYARDTMRVYARTSTTAAWTLLQTIAGPLTTWSRQSIDLSTVGGTNVQIALEYAYGSGLGLGVDNVRLGDASVCTTPNNLQAYRITSNSAELMWNAYEGAYQYGLKVSTTAMTSPATATADVFDQAVFSKPYQVTGLTPSTTYYFYVSAVCGVGDESSWSEAGTFKTTCAPETLPYSDAMEATSTYTTCWIKDWEANGDWGTTNPSASTYAPTVNSTHHNGTQSVRLYGYYSNLTSYASPRTVKSYVASHELNTTDIRRQQLTFWGYGSTVNAKVHVGVIVDPNDFSTFEELAVVQVDAASTWKEYIIPLSSATNPAANHICFMTDGADGTSTFYFYIDDVLVEDIPLCPKPSMLQANVVTQDHATVTWMGNSAAYTVKVSTTPLTDPATATADVLTTSVTTNSVTINNLSPRTTYYLYVQADCSGAGNGTSTWSNELSFTTTSVVAIPPYTCGFEDATENAQWDIYNGTCLNTWVIGTGANNGGTHALYISNDNGTTAGYAIASAISNVMAVRTILLPPGDHGISFDWQAGGESTIDYLRAELAPVNATFSPGSTAIGTATTAGFGGRLLSPVKTNLSNGWQHLDYNISVTDTTTYNLVFYWRNDNSVGTQPGAIIDNVTIETFACTTPVQFTADVPTTNSCNFNWISGGESQWQFQLLSGTDVVVDTILTTTSFSATGLESNTSYTARVRGACSATDFGYWRTVSFQTACDDIRTLPFTEDFQSLGTGSGATPSCWTVAKRYSTYPYVATAAYNHTPNSGTVGSLYFYATSTANNCIALPRLNVPGKTVQDMQISFWLLTTSLSYNMTVGVMTNPADFTTFVPVQTVTCDASSTTSNQNWKYIEIDFSQYTGNGQYIAFYDGTRATSNYAYIDDIILELIPTCPRPKNLSVVKVNESSVTLTFTSVYSSNFEAVAVPQGSALTAANIVATGTSTNDTVVIRGLNANTNYDCYVRSLCGTGDTSLWSSVVSCHTTAIPEALPLVTDFSNAADNAKWQLFNGSQTNKWYIGSATGNGDSNALYVSGDNGASTTYTTTTAVAVYAARLLQFVPGTYDISFDWKCQGESTYDLIRAFLVPTNVMLAAGDAFGMSGTTNTDPAGWISLTGENANGKLNLQANWQTVNTTFSVADTINYNLVFFWKNDGSGGTAPGGCIDNLSITPMNCAAGLSVEPTDNQVVFNFVPSMGTPTGYEIVVDNAAINLTNIGNVLYHNVITATTDTVANLTQNTSYFAYVRTLCGADTGRWIVADFKTACGEVALPHTWDFEDAAATGTGTSPDCWTHVSGGNYPYIYNNRSYGNGSKSLYFYSSSTSDPAVVAMPYLNVAAIQNYRVEFFTYYASSTSYGVIVGVMTNPADLTTFVPVDTVWTTMNAVWEPQTIRLRNYSGTGKYIAFRSDYGLRSAYNYINIDNVTVTEDRLCETPGFLGVSNLSGDGAQLNWTSNNGLTYDVVVATSEVLPDTVTNVGGDIFMYETGLTNNSLDLSGMLQTNTTYWFYVQADCQTSDNKPSLWSEGYQFTTVCPAYTLPYTQDFVISRPNTGAMPACWQVIYEETGVISGSSTYNVAPMVYKGANAYQKTATDSCSLRMSCYNSSTGSTKEFAILPEFSGSYAGNKLSFYTACTASADNVVGGYLLLGTLTDVSDASTFVCLDTIFSDNYWSYYAYPLDGINNVAGTHLAVLWDGDLNQKSGYFYIDKLAIEPYTTCEAPTNFRVENINGGEADIFLSTISPADSIVNIQVYLESTVVRDTVMNVADLPWHVSHLAGMTTFNVNARVVCNAADSTYSPYANYSLQFKTGCTAVTLPYSYNADDEPASGTGKHPTCWTSYQTNGGTSYPYVYATYSSSAPYSLYFYGTSTYATYGVLPELDVPSMQNVIMSMKLRKSTSTYNMVVGVMTDPEDPTTFQSVATVTPSTLNVFEEVNVTFAGYTGTGKYIALKIGGSATASMYVDDIYVEFEPTCHRPSTPTFISNTTTSITASWTAGSDGETSWDITALPSGHIPDAYTAYTTVSTPQGTIAGLQPNTAYDFFVRAACSATDHSNWVKATMTTACNAIVINDSVSFVDGFDTYGTGTSAHPDCWVTYTNYTSTAYPYISTTHNSGVGSLYFYGTSTYYSYAVTPELTGTPLNQLGLSFMGRSTSLNYRLEVGVMTNPYDPSTFTLIDVFTPTATSTWEPESAVFSSYQGTGKHIAFRIPNQITSYYYVDDVEIYALPACSAPDVRVNEITPDSVEVEIFPIFATDTAWQFVVTPPATGSAPVMTDALINRTVNITKDTIVGFPNNTSYTMFVRTICGSDATPWKVYNFKSPCGYVNIDPATPFTENFDSYGTGTGRTPDCWTCRTTGATVSYCSSSYKVSGAASLYFYNSTTNVSYVATPRLEGTPVNELEMTFKVYETTLADFEVGVLEDPEDISTFTSFGVFRPSATATWTDFTVRFSSYSGNAKYLAFKSHGATLTAYIDNVQIAPVPLCSAPGLSVNAVSHNDIRLNVVAANPADSIFEYVVTPASTATIPAMSSAIVRDTVAPGEYVLTTLAPGTSFSVYGHALCGTEWSRYDFVSPCVPVVVNDSLSFVENFDTYGTGYGHHPNCWTCNTNYTASTAGYPYINTTYTVSSPGALYFYGSTSYYSYAATPEITGTPVNQLTLTCSVRKTSAAYFCEVGVMTDPNDYSTFTAVATLQPTITTDFETFTVNLSSYTGDGHYVAFRAPQGAADYFYLDDVTISKIPDCAAPGMVPTFNNNTIELQLIPIKTTDTQWEVVVNRSPVVNDTTNSLFHQVVNTTNITIPNISYASLYYIHARTNCGDEWSTWGVTNIVTPCGVITLPYTENFATMTSTAAPNCWWLRNGLVDNVLNGTELLATNTGIWVANNSGYGLQGPHAKINNYSTSRKHWLISPEIFVDTTALLRFDVALTDYGNGNVVDNIGNQPDDRFVVLVSRDGGDHWNRSDVLAEWNNSGSPLVYDQIPNTGQTVELSLNDFIGDTIKVAFYAESTLSNGDNDLHVGNVNILAIRNIVDYTDNTCDGYLYVGHGFNLSASDIDLATSPNVFTRVEGDTLIRLTLNVMLSSETVLNDTVCSTALPYTLYGFNVSTAGTYNRYLTSAAGCDSIVTLNLVVNNGFTDSETVTICASALPYLWNGQTLTAAGTYTHTVAAPNGCDSTFVLNLVVTQAITADVNDAICQGQTYTWNGQSYSTAGDYTWTGTAFNGCDSIVTLHLTVNPVHYESIQLTIEQEETPYEWNGFSITETGSYTWNGQTAAGCDSVVTLDIYVHVVGLDYAEDGMFAISPNPVQRGGNVRLDVTLNEAERDGMVVEVYTSNGKLVSRFEPKEQPMFIKMPDIDGLYMVRLTTGTGRVLYGKVIVK